MLCILLACNYFAFRVELFSDEDEQNHPARKFDPNQLSISGPTSNWETFDKDNAPKAFVFDAVITMVCLSWAPQVASAVAPLLCSFEPIRDKSPPPDPV